MPTNCIHTDNQSKQESHVDEKHPLDEALGTIHEIAWRYAYLQCDWVERTRGSNNGH